MKRFFTTHWPEMLLVAMLAVILAFYGKVSGAPAPIRKAAVEPTPEISPPPIVGRWMMTWGSGRGLTEFRPDGTYMCLWAGHEWVGTWKAILVEKGEPLRFTITESLDGSAPCSWTVDLIKPPRAGELTWGADFSLVLPEEVPPDL